jgi:hypothetical protein
MFYPCASHRCGVWPILHDNLDVVQLGLEIFRQGVNCLGYEALKRIRTTIYRLHIRA